MGRSVGYTHDDETRKKISEALNAREIMVTKHQGHIDDDSHKAVCTCGAKFKKREYRFQRSDDLLAHYMKKGTLYRYLVKPHYRERMLA